MYADPNEIVLEDRDSIHALSLSISDESHIELQNRLPKYFEDFGLGNLSCHPILSKYFKPKSLSGSSNSRSDNSGPTLSTDIVIKLLLECLFQNSPSRVSVETFESFLRDRFQVDSLIDVGLYIHECKFQELLDQLISISRRSSNSEQLGCQSFIQEQKVMLDSLPQQKENRKEIKKVMVQSLSLKPPSTESKLSPLYGEIKSYFEKRSAFSPSVSAIRDYLSNERKVSNKRRKLESEVVAIQQPTVNGNNELLDIAGEYFFLHFGSKRDVSKRYILIDNAQKQEENKEDGSIIDLVTSYDEIKEHSSLVEPEKEEGQRNEETKKTIQAHVPVEYKRYIDRDLPTALQDEVSTMILEISNLQLREVLNNIHIPPLPPLALPSTNSVYSRQDISVSNQIGRLGECIVFQYLKSRFEQSLSVSGDISPMYQVQWLNESEDHRAPYDLTIDPSKSVGGGRIFVEVKSSRFDDNNVFQLSLWEWEFIAQKPAVPYHLYRVFSAQDKTKTRIVVLTNIRRLLEIGRIQLCLSI